MSIVGAVENVGSNRDKKLAEHVRDVLENFDTGVGTSVAAIT